VIPKVFLKQSRRKRLESGHPWIYQSEVDFVDGDIKPGDIVDIVNHKGVFLARGYANPQSQIFARVLTYDADTAIDAEFFKRRIQDAWDYRRRFLEDTSACRAIYGEADFLPGLIVDKYDDVLVVQILSFGMEVQKENLLRGLVDVFSPRGIYLRNDVPVRELEGLTQESGVWYGDVPEEVIILENGLKFIVNVREGQKTGYFFDQRDNRASIRPLMTGWSPLQNSETSKVGAAYADGADVLECFCHTGAFTVHALHYGARHVTAVDISEPAIEVARRNAELNGFADRVEFVVANAFDYLREADRQGKRYDVVILDPPAFAKSRRALPGAIRGYKEINLRGLKLVRDGGFLVTASCSYHMSPELFRETILDAAFDAHKVLRLVHWTGAGKDHPEIAGVDEGHYLKFAIFQVHSR
jgi:23S rRNA (cytosine1962-C5)-methyltransferase